jgi:hypothetical protein
VNESQDVRINLVNTLGQEVTSERFESAQGQFSTKVDLTGLTPGIYLVQIAVGNTIQVKRAILK